MKYYHNNRCRKSREGLAFLESKNIQPKIINYLENKISIDEAMEKIFIRTRQYAKRQNKWFSSNKYDLSFNIEKNTSNDIVDKLTQIN